MHPFDPLYPGEITRVTNRLSIIIYGKLDIFADNKLSQAASIVRARFPKDELNFRVITLQEPAKKEMVVFLDREHRGLPSTDIRPPRIARVQVIRDDPTKDQLIELFINLSAETIIKQQHLEGKHSYIDLAYMRAAEKACEADERVQAEIKKLDLPAGSTTCIEPWAYATDGSNDMSDRTTMVCTVNFILLSIFWCVCTD
jgi:primary-amine oxidase